MTTITKTGTGTLSFELVADMTDLTFRFINVTNVTENKSKTNATKYIVQPTKDSSHLHYFGNEYVLKPLSKQLKWK